MAKRKRRGHGYCCYCKRPLQKSTARGGLAKTRDHVKPKCLGGRKTVLCCRACNNLKGDMTPEQWRTYTETNPKWWRNYDVG